MRIQNHHRFALFSDRVPVSCLLPTTCFRFTFFPTKLYVEDSEGKESSGQIAVPGPVRKQVVQQDLERGEIIVWGDAGRQYFRYRIVPSGVSWGIIPEKGQLHFPEHWIIDTRAPRKWLLPEKRLSFGIYKKQNWDQILHRFDPKEWLPFWYRLGLLTPHLSAVAEGGQDLLTNCKEKVEKCCKLELEEAFCDLFHAGFEQMLCPRDHDKEKRGFSLAPVASGSSLSLLTEGARCIERIFFNVCEKEIHLLPAVPPLFHCGKIGGLEAFGALFSLEWSKKQIRRVAIEASAASSFAFVLPSEIKQFRLCRNDRDRGTLCKRGQLLDFPEPGRYFLDHFEK